MRLEPRKGGRKTSAKLRMFQVDRDAVDDAVLPWRASGAMDGITASPHFLIQPSIDRVNIAAKFALGSDEEQSHRQGGIVDFRLRGPVAV